METVAGEASEREINSSFCRIEWTVDEVQSILLKDGDFFRSGSFKFCGGDWTLEMMRVVETGKIQCLCIHVQRHSNSSHKIYLEYKVTKSNKYGEEHVLLKYKHEVDKGIWGYWVSSVLSGQNFSWSEETVFHLKVVCTLECFECNSEVVEHIPSLRDVQELVIGGEGGDLRINVKGKLFKVHKSIMRERSPVFDAMFRHDMLNTKTGEVNITDCEPEAFQTFLEYLHSHSNTLEFDDSMDIVYSLYPITDMYEVSEARAKCVKYMLENLDLETFCDIAKLSLRHVHSELRESVNRFFEENSEAISPTRRWRAFRAENPAAAYDFLTRVGS